LVALAARGRPAHRALDTLVPYAPVYLSPHYDDVCFSLGAMAHALNRGTLVNLFTRSVYLANPGAAAARARSVEEVSALRRAEDDRFAALCSMRTTALELEEPALRGRRPHGEGLEDDLAQLEGPLLRTLDELAASTPGLRALFCPAAIGSHVNHVAALMTVARHFPRLEEKYRVFFYEDLFYSAAYGRRIAGLFRLKRTVGQDRYGIRRVHRLEDAGKEKLSLIGLYASQHKREPTIAHFSPATFPWSRPHEAFWEFARR
jgi:hypothetical protein